MRQILRCRVLGVFLQHWGKKADCHEAVCGYTVDVSPVTILFFLTALGSYIITCNVLQIFVFLYIDCFQLKGDHLDTF